MPGPIVDMDDPPELSAHAKSTSAENVQSSTSGYVLWDQYANWSITDHAAQDFEAGHDIYDIYAADDFENTVSWEIDTIVTRGGWGTFVDLNGATSIQWWICPDNGGEPLCDPPNDGSAVWSISLPPSNPQVQLGKYEPEDVVLTLDNPIPLPPGHWWLVYQVSLNYTSYSQQYGWSGTSPVWGAQGMQNNPLNGFGKGVGWWNNSYGEDYMFRLEGSLYLWDQYANWSGLNFAAQDFEPAYDTYDIFAADDFENTVTWEIDTLITRGGWGGFVDLNNATSIQWWICPDWGGEPLCDPPYDGSAFWSTSLSPSNPQVQLGVYEAEDVVLTLDTPFELPPGHWWLVYQVSLNYINYSQYGWSGTSDPVWGAQGKHNNPGGAFGMGAGWWNNSYGYDYMFRIGGGEVHRNYLPLFKK